MTSQWQPHREPLRASMLRAVAIAIVVGAPLARLFGGMDRWPLTALLVFWFSFGGHWVEIGFLNWLRPRLSGARGWQAVARMGVWFAGGAVLFIGMILTAKLSGGFQPRHWPAWWSGGLSFIGVELIMHAGLQLRGRPSFFNGRG